MMDATTRTRAAVFVAAATWAALSALEPTGGQGARARLNARTRCGCPLSFRRLRFGQMHDGRGVDLPRREARAFVAVALCARAHACCAVHRALLPVHCVVPCACRAPCVPARARTNTHTGTRLAAARRAQPRALPQACPTNSGRTTKVGNNYASRPTAYTPTVARRTARTAPRGSLASPPAWSQQRHASPSRGG